MGRERTPPVPYLLRQVRVGVVATALTVASLGVAYFILGDGPSNDAALAGILVVAALGGVVIVLLPWRRLLESTGMRLFYAWSAADIVLISLAIAATGGGRSDLFLLYALTTFFFVASYPARAQLVLLVLTVLCYVAVLSLTGWHIGAGTFLVQVSTLAVLAYLAGYMNKELLDHLESEGAARAEADERSVLMSAVATAGRDLSLDPGHVVEVVLDAATGLGFADSAFVALREDGGVSHVVASRGAFAEEERDAPGPIEATDLVVAQGAAIVIGDGDADPSIAGTLLACPIWVGGWMAAALVGRVHEPSTPARRRLEAFEILATNAGLALDNAGRYEEQRQTVERLEEAERLKSDFLTTVSHELRTPLTSILGNASTLERCWADLDEDTRLQMLASLTARARELDEKITGLVNVSGSESATEGTFRTLDLSALLARVLEHAADRLSQHRVAADVCPGLLTFGDESLLARAVGNLLENAAVHTPAGTHVTLHAGPEGPSTILVAVSDDGPGIAPDDLPYVGARFFRGGDLNVRPTGMGVGLALVSSAAELHGSALEVRSEPQQGARFAFRLPAVDPSSAIAQELEGTAR